jgi:hypothetical protein
VKPGAAAGEWLFPALSSRNMRVRCHFDPGGFRHWPPPLYPGEVGDHFYETAVVLLLTAPADARKAALRAAEKLTEARLNAALRPPAPAPAPAEDSSSPGTGQKQFSVLMSDEELARGAQVLPQRACLEWDVRGARLLAPAAKELEAQVAVEERRHAEAGTAVVRVVLRMGRARAQERLAALRATVADIVGLPDAGDVGAGGGAGVRVVGVSGRTTRYCAVASVADLRKRLGELSNADLRMAAREEWGIAAVHENRDGKKRMSRAGVMSAVADAFVRRELRADLAAALRCGFAAADRDSDASAASALDMAIGELFRHWAPGTALDAAVRAKRIEQAVAALDSEHQWGEVEGWVRLQRVRIQGRTRLGLEGLMQREVEKIRQYKLTQGEVLAVYLYTGPEFVPMNGICSSFPQTIMTLLEGGGTTGDNKLCTTLFCISSALKKLSQNTELPETRCPAPRRRAAPECTRVQVRRRSLCGASRE